MKLFRVSKEIQRWVPMISLKGLRVSLVLLILACGDSASTPSGGSTPTSPTPTPTPVATSITLSATSLSFTAMGETIQISATVLDQSGKAMTGATVSWSSSDGSVADVSSTGLVTAIGTGTATITGTSGSANATASVVVQEMTSALPDTEIDSGPAEGSTQRDTEAAFSFFADQP